MLRAFSLVQTLVVLLTLYVPGNEVRGAIASYRQLSLFPFACQRQHYGNDVFAGKKAGERDYFVTVTGISAQD